MYVQTIEKHYAKNVTHFNTVVAPACGMLIGYLYRPKGELAYRSHSTSAYVFHPGDIGFDTSHAYYPYATFAFFGVVFSWLLLKSLVYLMIYLAHWFRPRPSSLSPDIQAQLKDLNFDSLETLSRLLSPSFEQRHYQHRLFVIRERNLIVLHVDWNEHDPQRLRQFYDRSPFTVYTVASINKVFANGFCIRDREKKHGFRSQLRRITWMTRRPIGFTSK